MSGDEIHEGSEGSATKLSGPAERHFFFSKQLKRQQSRRFQRKVRCMRTGNLEECHRYFYFHCFHA